MNHLNRSKRQGFALVELLIIFGIVLLLTSILLPTLVKARAAESRTQCAKNLKLIGQAMLLYANENAGRYPRTYYNPIDAKTKETLENPVWSVELTGNDKNSPFAFERIGDSPVGNNNVPAALFLLLRTQDITAKEFVCPGTQAKADTYQLATIPKSNVLGAGNFCNAKGKGINGYASVNSYSFHMMYAGKAAVADGFVWTNTLLADFAIAADINPGDVRNDFGTTIFTVKTTSSAEEQKGGNSPNHEYEGQNVLYGDCHVEFVQTSFAGVKQDNIYGVSAGSDKKDNEIVWKPENNPDSICKRLSPAHKNDSFLVPTAAD